MELILKEDVENLGFKDDIVNVKNGYGRNFLIPQGLATLATESNKKVLQEKIKQSQNKQKKAIIWIGLFFWGLFILKDFI